MTAQAAIIVKLKVVLLFKIDLIKLSFLLSMGLYRKKTTPVRANFNMYKLAFGG